MAKKNEQDVHRELTRIADEFGEGLDRRMPSLYADILRELKLRPDDITPDMLRRAESEVRRREHLSRESYYEGIRLVNMNPNVAMYVVNTGHAELDPANNDDFLAGVHPCKWDSVIADYPRLADHKPDSKAYKAPRRPDPVPKGVRPSETKSPILRKIERVEKQPPERGDRLDNVRNRMRAQAASTVEAVAPEPRRSKTMATETTLTVPKSQAVALCEALEIASVTQKSPLPMLTRKLKTFYTIPAKERKLPDKSLARLLAEIVEATEDEREIEVVDDPKNARKAGKAQAVEDDDEPDIDEEIEDEPEDDDEPAEEDDEPVAKKGGKVAKPKPKPGRKVVSDGEGKGVFGGGSQNGVAFERKYKKPPSGESVRDILWKAWRKARGKLTVDEGHKLVSKYAKRTTVNIWLWKFRKGLYKG